MTQISFGISGFPLLLEDISSQLGELLFHGFFYYFPPDIIQFCDDFPMKVFLFWKRIVKKEKKLWKRKRNQMLISVHVN